MEMMPLDPAQVSVMRARAAIAAAIVMAAILILGSAFLDEAPVLIGAATGAAALLLATGVTLWPRRRYRSWGYALDADEIHIQQGVLTRTRTAVPFGRVQHIDVSQGPIERHYGVGTLVLHTAGTRSSAVVLPGLAFAEAGRIRDEIRAKIRQDLL